MQKVVSINVLSRILNETKDGKDFKELEFPVLSKYLEEGYKVVQFYQISTSPQLYVVTLTFILEKHEH